MSCSTPIYKLVLNFEGHDFICHLLQVLLVSLNPEFSHNLIDNTLGSVFILCEAFVHFDQTN